MDHREQKIIEELKSRTEDTQVPESLEAERIEKLLEEKKPAAGSGKRWKRSYTAGLAAACCLLVCGAVYGLSNQGKPAGNETSSESGERAESEELTTADSYEDIYAYVEKYKEKYASDTYAMPEAKTDGTLIEGRAGTAANESASSADAGTSEISAQSSESAGAATAQSAEAFSETNVRQEGVDEADIVKTDGRYIYTLTDDGDTVSVVDTTESLAFKGKIKDDDAGTIQEFYVKDKKLILIYTINARWYAHPLGGRSSLIDETKAVTYDISDPENPKKLGEVSQSGSYRSSRISGGHLYLFSEHYADISARKDDIELYIPSAGGELLPRDSIYLPYTEEACMYEIVTSVDINQPGEIADSKAILADGGQVYVSNENIYWYEQSWGQRVVTTIRKLHYEDGQIEAVAKGEVDGYINDSFSIDEYKGKLRVVTTDGDSNGVYVLDEKMEVIGAIEGLAKDERVYSARFFGDTGYFVTFRQRDPLFSVDLSDPENPKIIGELKIPGFSEYLHFYGEDMLLGIGMDADEETGVTGGVKLSMFDISDSSDVKEVHTYIMDNVYSTDVLYNYKAVLIDEGKNVIGFSAYEGSSEKYYVFSYDAKDGFTCKMEERINGSGYQTARGLYIGDVLYVVKGNIIEAYSMDDYKKIDDIII